MKIRYMTSALALVFSSLVILAGLTRESKPSLPMDGGQAYQFEIPIRSEVVPLRSILIQSELTADEVAQIKSALEDDKLRYVPEALVILTAQGFKDQNGDGLIDFDLVDQTGDDIDRSVSVSAKAVRDRRLARDFARIDRWKTEGRFEDSPHSVNFELWKYSYSEYAIDRSIAHGEAGLKFSDGRALDYSELFEVFGYATTQFEGETRLYPVSGRLVSGHLQLSSFPNWSEYLQKAQSLKALAHWDKLHVLPEFERWNEARRNKDESKERIDAIVEEIVDLKRSEDRTQLADRVRQGFSTAPETTFLQGKLSSGESVDWSVNLQSGQLVTAEIEPKFYSYSNSSNHAEPRAHFMHWIEIEGLETPNGETAIAGLFSEYIKDRSNRSFVCQGAPVDELHQSIVGAGTPHDYAFLQPDYYEGDLDIVKMFALSKNEAEPGFAFNIVYWFIFRDETHGRSFLDLDRNLSTPTRFVE